MTTANLSRRDSSAMKDEFNITLIVPDGYLHSWALAEVGEYLAYCISRCGFDAQLSQNFISADCHNIVLCGHMLTEQSFATMPADTILFNSEQLDDTEGWQFGNRVYRTALDRFYVWDYCSANLAKLGHERKTQIPLLFCEALVRRDYRWQMGDALVFCGAWNPRRAKILEVLARAGVKAAFLSQSYGEERDRVMFNAWAVLNLHKTEHLKVFEPVRCFYPLINQIPVISEEFDPDPAFGAFADSVFAIESGAFVAGVCRLYRNRSRFQSQARRNADKFRSTDPLPEIRSALSTYLETVKALA
jgi:hypothetical protein